ncbi:hypothetical protein SAY86_000219 [Trapa natans]|uniref:CASP-like protein n=1 Tax=Trapa natans TaxID=22666 RepID=A0AAN7MEN8_TRANT|nr:hypothetical protein SAY86_000219 [Trapa natans]
MKDLIGGPGTVSGLLLRIGQSVFAAASIVAMVTSVGFYRYTAFCFLIASMGLQVLWSFGLTCLDIYALRKKRDLQNPVLVSLFVVGYSHIITCCFLCISRNGCAVCSRHWLLQKGLHSFMQGFANFCGIRLYHMVPYCHVITCYVLDACFSVVKFNLSLMSLMPPQTYL